MKNIDVIRKFFRRAKASSSNGNLRSTGDRLFSYNTCIAEWSSYHIAYDGETATICSYALVVNTTKYSKSTSRIQNMLLSELPFGKTVYKVDNVPINTQKLWIERT